jgi:hypothetical protein
VDSLPVVVALAAFGILAIIAGVIVWRGAHRIVEDARRELEGMFGDRAGFEGAAPKPLTARIAGAGFAGVGVVLLVVAVVLLVLSR